MTVYDKYQKLKKQAAEYEAQANSLKKKLDQELLAVIHEQKIESPDELRAILMAANNQETAKLDGPKVSDAFLKRQNRIQERRDADEISTADDLTKDWNDDTESASIHGKRGTTAALEGSQASLHPRASASIELPAMKDDEPIETVTISDKAAPLDGEQLQDDVFSAPDKQSDIRSDEEDYRIADNPNNGTPFDDNPFDAIYPMTSHVLNNEVMVAGPTQPLPAEISAAGTKMVLAPSLLPLFDRNTKQTKYLLLMLNPGNLPEEWRGSNVPIYNVQHSDDAPNKVTLTPISNATKQKQALVAFQGAIDDERHAKHPGNSAANQDAMQEFEAHRQAHMQKMAKKDKNPVTSATIEHDSKAIDELMDHLSK